MKTTQFRQSETGFSIIEIMIAMLIGIFLLGGLMQMFVSSKQTYKLQDTVSRLQENGRFAMDFLIRDIRGTGAWGCFSNSVNITNLLNDKDEPFKSAYIGIQGENNHVSTGTTDKVLAGTDVISLRSTSALVDANGADIMINKIDNSASLHVSANDTVKEKDILFVSDCADGNLFQATKVNPSGEEITHSPGKGAGLPTPGNATKDFTKEYGNDARLYKASFVRYEIRTGESGQPSLFKTENDGTAQEFIEGVENMQIEYGEDIDADGTPNRYQTADKIGNWQQVVSVKISLLVRSLEDNLANAPIAYTYNSATVTPTDKRIRRIFSSVIAVRNRLI